MRGKSNDMIAVPTTSIEYTSSNTAKSSHVKSFDNDSNQDESEGIHNDKLIFKNDDANLTTSSNNEDKREYSIKSVYTQID